MNKLFVYFMLAMLAVAVIGMRVKQEDNAEGEAPPEEASPEGEEAPAEGEEAPEEGEEAPAEGEEATEEVTPEEGESEVPEEAGEEAIEGDGMEEEEEQLAPEGTLEEMAPEDTLEESAQTPEAEAMESAEDEEIEPGQFKEEDLKNIPAMGLTATPVTEGEEVLETGAGESQASTPSSEGVEASAANTTPSAPPPPAAATPCQESQELYDKWTKARTDFRVASRSRWEPVEEVDAVLDATADSDVDDTTLGCIVTKVANEAGVSSTCEGFEVGVDSLVDHGYDEEAAETMSDEGAKRFWSWYTGVDQICPQ